MESAKEKLEASKVSRIDTVQTHLTSDCVEDCSGHSYSVPTTFFCSTSIKYLLIHDRGKKRNLIITGPANCAKTFMLKPLKLVFSDSIFENLANDKYACVGPEKAKVFLLNDFRWSKDFCLKVKP